jgi:DNA-binding transcriptional LysR family regulator
MNVQHLQYFLAMMETGSVSRAAERIGITQPTLSVALKRLEKQFGVRLFAADGRGLRALPSAERLEQYARMAVRAMSEAKRDLDQGASNRLRIGLLPSLSPGWLAAVVRAWHGPLQIMEASAEELQEQVSRESLDIVLTALPDNPKSPHHLMLREPFKLFTSNTHEFARQRTVALAALNQQPFVLRQSCERTGMGRRLVEVAGIRFKVVAKTKQEATAAALVATGIGCTLAPRSWGFPGLNSIEVAGLQLDRRIGLLWKTTKGARGATKMIQALEAQIISLPTPPTMA